VVVALLGCLTPPPADGPAELVVEVLQGIRPASLEGLAQPAPSWVVADLGAADPASTLAAAKRAATVRYLAALSAGSLSGLVLVGTPGSEACGPPQLLRSSGSGAAASFAARLRTLAPGPQGSLGRALERLDQELEGQPLVPAPRLVVFSDFTGSCPVDSCAAAASLVQRGIQIDWVAVGPAPLPACLLNLGPPSTAAGMGIDLRPTVREVSLQVQPHHAGSLATQVDGAPLPRAADGRTGQLLTLAPGVGRVVVGLDPPMVIWPVWLEPNRLTRIRILDSPLLGVRRKFADTIARAAGQEELGNGPPALLPGQARPAGEP